MKHWTLQFIKLVLCPDTVIGNFIQLQRVTANDLSDTIGSTAWGVHYPHKINKDNNENRSLECSLNWVKKIFCKSCVSITVVYYWIKDYLWKWRVIFLKKLHFLIVEVIDKIVELMFQHCCTGIRRHDFSIIDNIVYRDFCILLLCAGGI